MLRIYKYLPKNICAWFIFLCMHVFVYIYIYDYNIFMLTKLSIISKMLLNSLFYYLFYVFVILLFTT